MLNLRDPDRHSRANGILGSEDEVGRDDELDSTEFRNSPEHNRD